MKTTPFSSLDLYEEEENAGLKPTGCWLNHNKSLATVCILLS